MNCFCASSFPKKVFLKVFYRKVHSYCKRHLWHHNIRPEIPQRKELWCCVEICALVRVCFLFPPGLERVLNGQSLIGTAVWVFWGIFTSAWPTEISLCDRTWKFPSNTSTRVVPTLPAHTTSPTILAPTAAFTKVKSFGQKCLAVPPSLGMSQEGAN